MTGTGWSQMTHSETCFVIPLEKEDAQQAHILPSRQGFAFAYIDKHTVENKPHALIASYARSASGQEPYHRIYSFYQMNNTPRVEWAKDIAADKEKLAAALKVAEQKDDATEIKQIKEHEEAIIMLEDIVNNGRMTELSSLPNSFINELDPAFVKDKKLHQEVGIMTTTAPVSEPSRYHQNYRLVN